jgi:NADH:ubiquinone oxidoreductase subunit 2 (subunit N)
MSLNNIKFTYETAQYFPYLFLLIAFLALLIWATIYNDTHFINAETQYLSTMVLTITLMLVCCSLDYGDNGRTYPDELGILYDNPLSCVKYSIFSFIHHSQLIVYFEILILLISISALLITPTYIKNYFTNYSVQSYEYSLLIVFNVLAMFLLISAYNLVTLYLALELNSMTAYIFISLKQNEGSLQASLKYFIVSCLSSLFFLLGFSLWYGFTGVSDYDDIKLIIKLYKHLYYK